MSTIKDVVANHTPDATFTNLLEVAVGRAGGTPGSELAGNELAWSATVMTGEDKRSAACGGGGARTMLPRGST